MLNPNFSSHSSSLHLGETIPPINILVGVKGPGELAAEEQGLRSTLDVGLGVELDPQDAAGGGVGQKKEFIDPASGVYISTSRE